MYSLLLKISFLFSYYNTFLCSFLVGSVQSNCNNCPIIPFRKQRLEILQAFNPFLNHPRKEHFQPTVRIFKYILLGFTHQHKIMLNIAPLNHIMNCYCKQVNGCKGCVSTCYPDVLQARHQFAVEATHGVSCEKAAGFLAQVFVDLTQV